MSLDVGVLGEIAAEFGVDVAFIEKDWYSCQALKLIASIHDENIDIIFSGGTSLSKAHNLIQRFSEDLDFRCHYNSTMSGNQQKKARSALREKIVSGLQNLGVFNLDDQDISIASNYIKFPLKYDTVCEAHSALRPHLEIEFSFTPPQIPAVDKDIASFVDIFTATDSKITMPCLNSIEIAADKLSALCWRILKRDRRKPGDDPALVRHLHDLCALENDILSQFDRFVELLEQAFEVDQQSTSRNTGVALVDSLRAAGTFLVEDPLYNEEYQRFVDAMSYAKDDEMISYDRAKNAFLSLLDDIARF